MQITTGIWILAGARFENFAAFGKVRGPESLPNAWHRTDFVILAFLPRILLFVKPN